MPAKGSAMLSQLHISDLPLILDFSHKQSASASQTNFFQGRTDAVLARYQALYQARRCVHVACRIENRIVALAGALFVDDTPFLSTKTKRYAQIIDEHVAPDCPVPDAGALLHTAILAIIAENNAILTYEPPANQARLDAFGSGNFRL